MKFFNRQFGELEVEEKHLLHFPEGIIGFEEYRKFLMVHDEDSEPFRWLVSLDDANVSFPLLDPTLLDPEYGQRISLHDNDVVFVVTTLSQKIEESTVNLRSPIIIDKTTQIGRQVVLENDTLPFQCPLVPSPSTKTRG